VNRLVYDIRHFAAISEINRQQWNTLDGTDCPFLRHEFLSALEDTGCAAPSTGWTASHIGLFDGEQLLAACPAYRKTHSWGEFVFDFGWARAYERHQLHYYPKLTCMAPFSPVNGPRLLVRADADVTTLHTAVPPRATLHDALIAQLEQLTAAQRLSSAHALFIDSAERDAFATRGWLLRRDVQFHWNNAGYRDFEDYLARFSAEYRKKIRRERRRCAEAGITFRMVPAHTLPPETLRHVHALHAHTFHLHGHQPYLSLRCFMQLAATLPDAMWVTLALRDEQLLAAAVFFRSSTTLYGRYWGAAEAQHSLHFETCYHQGIEFCIAQGLQRFEPGTQGEHKISRGFEPALTWSAHHIADPRFRAAIGEFLEAEAPAVNQYAAQVAAHTPYRRL
jgi:predicted N-acyltransferase